MKITKRKRPKKCKHSVAASKLGNEPWKLGPELVCGKCGVYLKPPTAWVEL